DVVEVAEPDQLRLAAEELDLSRPRLREPPLEVAAFLRGDREERDAARQMLGGAGVDQRHRRAQHPRDLRLVPARVHRAGRRIRFRVPGNGERVELPDQRERGAVTGTPAHVGTDAREREPRPRLEIERAERLLDQSRRLHFLEAELGMAADLLADPDDLLGAAVDRVPETLLQRGSAHGGPRGEYDRGNP